MARKRRYMTGAALLLVLLLAGCSLSDFSKIPDSGFITHLQRNDHKRMPFDSYWDISDNAQWDRRVAGLKSQEVYIAPVTLRYFVGMPAEAEQQAEIRKLRDYFDERLAAELAKLDAANPHFHLVPSPTPNSYRVEIALLSAQQENKLDNLMSDLTGMLVSGAGLLTSRKADRGYISMGAKYYSPEGKLVAEVADFEYGQSSLTGMLLVDTKDFRTFAYQRQTIDQWVHELAKLLITPHEQKVSKPRFTLNPF